MAKIIILKIENYRGIKNFDYTFSDNNLTCFIGRGDSGKSTILDAISSVLSPSWNLTFYDSDFFDCDISKPIIVEVTLINLPITFLKEPIGLHLRGIDKEGKIQDELTDECEPAITIRLEVNAELEPKWSIVNNRQDDYPISAQTRMKLGVFLISDYTDGHFNWTRGNPLQAILNQTDDTTDGNSNIIIEALRVAKTQIDSSTFGGLNETIEKIKINANALGVDISATVTSIDFKDISIRDNKISLHDNKIPFRLKGKGSKRLISTAIQSTLVKDGGIILIDEIEQGLEPDRVKHLVRTLETKTNTQVIITTHSQNVIEEIDSDNVIKLKNKVGEVSYIACDEKTQDILRACPEALYANKVIVCEGKTEIGICRAIDIHCIDTKRVNLSGLGIVYTLGEGSKVTLRAEKLNALGVTACVLCDSDRDAELTPKKEDVKSKGVQIFDWENNNNIETQLFKDLPWSAIMELLVYKQSDIGEESFISKLNTQLPSKIKNLNELVDSAELRKILTTLSIKKESEWFKRIDHGEFLGKIIFKCFDEITTTFLHKQISALITWIINES